MRLLVLGGTSWVGGTVASVAVREGHEVTCLARGESGPVPAGARWVRADRGASGAYDDVAEEWDAVLDVSWQPSMVRSALDSLAGRVRHWVYVSSISVYADHGHHAGDEHGDTLAPWSPADQDVEATAEEYGAAKVSCETACAEQIDPDRLLVARPGLIAGHGDPSDRFGYWPARVARAGGGAPGLLVPSLGGPVQVIDVEDLAAWLVQGCVQRTAGVFDAVGDQVTLGAVLEACFDACGTRPRLHEAQESWLLERGVRPWAGPDSLPLWLPHASSGMVRRSGRAAREAGLAVRPLTQTVAGALRWEREQGVDRARRAGLRADREAALVAAL